MVSVLQRKFPHHFLTLLNFIFREMSEPFDSLLLVQKVVQDLYEVQSFLVAQTTLGHVGLDTRLAKACTGLRLHCIS